MSNPLTTLPAALAALDHTLAASVELRGKLVAYRTECDGLHALLTQANNHNARLAVEFAQAHAEREQLRDSLEATTALVADLTAERSVLRRRCEELSTQRDTWRGAASSA